MKESCFKTGALVIAARVLGVCVLFSLALVVIGLLLVLSSLRNQNAAWLTGFGALGLKNLCGVVHAEAQKPSIV